MVLSQKLSYLSMMFNCSDIYKTMDELVWPVDFLHNKSNQSNITRKIRINFVQSLNLDIRSASKRFVFIALWYKYLFLFTFTFVLLPGYCNPTSSQEIYIFFSLHKIIKTKYNKGKGFLLYSKADQFCSHCEPVHARG